MLTLSYIFFNADIFNVFIRCIWFNATYIMPRIYCTTLLYERVIGPTLCYQEWALIWSFIFACSIISEHDFISNFVVVVNSLIFSRMLSLSIIECFC